MPYLAKTGFGAYCMCNCMLNVWYVKHINSIIRTQYITNISFNTYIKMKQWKAPILLQTCLISNLCFKKKMKQWTNPIHFYLNFNNYR